MWREIASRPFPLATTIAAAALLAAMLFSPGFGNAGGGNEGTTTGQGASLQVEPAAAAEQNFDDTVRIELLEKHDENIGQKIAGAFFLMEPQKVTAVVPEVGTFTSHSERTTISTRKGYVVGVTLLPMKEAADFEQATTELANLLGQWDIEVDENIREALERWKEQAGQGRVGRQKRSAVMHFPSGRRFDVELRPAPVEGWFLAVDFDAGIEARRRIRDEHRQAVRDEVAERLENEVFDSAKTDGERFEQLDAFLNEPPRWFASPADRDERQEVRAARSVLAEVAVDTAGIEGIERLNEAEIGWREAAERADLLAEYLDQLDPNRVLEDEWLLGAISSYVNNSELVEQQLQSWLEEADEPEVQRKWVDTIADSVGGNRPRASRMIELLKDDRRTVRMAAAEHILPVISPTSEIIDELEGQIQRLRGNGLADEEELDKLESILEKLEGGGTRFETHLGR